MSRHMSRRSFLKAALTISGGAVLAACAPATAVPPTTAPPETAVPAVPATTVPAVPATTVPAAPATSVPATSAPVATVAPQVGAKKLTFATYTFSDFESAMNKLLDQWTQLNPGVTVERQYAPWDDFWTRLQTQIAGGAPPDVTIADFGRIIGYGQSDVLLPLNPYLDSSKFPLDQMNPAAVSSFRWTKGDFKMGGDGGNLYGLPGDMQDCVFFYNKKLFDAAGVQYPTDDWTWNEVVVAGKKLTNKDKNQYGTGTPGMMDRGLWQWMAGAELRTPDYKKSLVDSPESISVYKWIWDMIYTDKIAPAPNLASATNPFISGQVAMYFDGVWNMPDFVTALKDDFDVALLPKHPTTGKRTTSIESDGWWIFKASKEPDLAFSLLVYLADPAGQKRLNDLGYLIPSCIPTVAKDWFGQTPPAHRSKALDNIVQESRMTDLTYYDCQTVSAAYLTPINAALADGTDITAAAKEAAKVMDDELVKAWERFNAAS